MIAIVTDTHSAEIAVIGFALSIPVQLPEPAVFCDVMNK